MRRLLPICLALACGTAAAPATEPPVTEPPATAATLRLAPAPPDPATRESMRRWHLATHERISPVLREWRRLAQAARERPGRPLAAGCRRLDLALTRLDRRGLAAAPDASASLHLERTLRLLRGAAGSCSQGAWFLTSWRLRQAEDSWRELRARLSVYGLVP